MWCRRGIHLSEILVTHSSGFNLEGINFEEIHFYGRKFGVRWFCEDVSITLKSVFTSNLGTRDKVCRVPTKR